MNPNLQCLVKACELEAIAYQVYHRSQNVVAVGPWFFVNWAVPLLSHSIARLCTDKDYSFEIFSSVIRMPRSKSILTPLLEQHFENYREQTSLPSMLATVMDWSSLPLVVKPNSASHGVGVRLCNTWEEVEAGLLAVLNPHSKDYDYVALVQQYIPWKREARIVLLDGAIVLAYWKDIVGATCEGNLSPLHWSGSRAVRCSETERVAFQFFLDPLFRRCPELRYVGVDVLVDENDDFWLLELNGSPGFRIFIRDNGEAEVIALYRKVLRLLELV